MYTQWAVQYDKYKDRWNYGTIEDHYMRKPTERITGGFRILPTGKHPQQHVINPYQFTKFIGDVLVHAKDHSERKKAIKHVIEHCLGKPEGPLQAYNALLLDLSVEQEAALRVQYRFSSASSLGPLAVGDAYFECKVFRSWNPEQTQAIRDADGNVEVTFYDYNQNRIGIFLIAPSIDT